MNVQELNSPLLSYMEAWRREDVAAILRPLTPDVIVIESYGPVYRSVERVEQWARTWLEQGGRVHNWEVLTHRTDHGFEIAEWRFDHTWEGKRSAFEGCTLVTLKGDLIATLREYQTTAPLYDWTGSWKE